MRYRYLDDFRRGISVFAIFSYGIAVLGTPQCPPLIWSTWPHNNRTNLGPLHMSPVDRAGSVTGMNFALGSYEKFQPGFRDEKRSDFSSLL